MLTDACVAVIRAWPTPITVTVLPETVATDGVSLVYVMTPPDEGAAVGAVSVNAAAPAILVGTVKPDRTTAVPLTTSVAVADVAA